MKTKTLLFLCLCFYLNGHATPVITSFSPVSGAPGTTVTIVGIGFSGTPANNIVYFGAVKATVSTSTFSSIKITVPWGSGSVVPISVTVQGAVAYSNACSTPTFTLTNSPNLDLAYNRTDIAITETHLGFMDIGDFNGDGKDDLVVTDYITNKVKVLLGNGDGTFASAVNYPVGGSCPFFVKACDFNGDGKTDLFTANACSSNVSILLGNGDGTFTTAANYSAGTSPYSVAIGDFNGDGKTDLAIPNEASNNISILLGIGDGTFATAVNYPTPNISSSVVIGDFNGDGKTDLATANDGNSNVSVLLGKGDGTFAAAVNYTVGGCPQSITIGDFNKDGKADLATANNCSSNVSVLLGIGDGTFATSVNYSLAANPYSVTVGDFNGDGKIDLAAASINANVSLFLGIGDGTFAAPVNFTAYNGSWSIAVGDFNGDGKTDWACANGQSNNISVFLNTSLAITTQTVSSITSATATGNGTITALGLSNPTAYGICWNTTGTPTISDGKVDKGAASTIGTFTASITGLTSNTTYHVRAYATNTSGTVYGNEVTFTTNASTGLFNATTSTLSIYPNPTTDGFTINAGENTTTIAIYDLSGSLVLTQQTTGSTYINAISLKPGMYVVKANGLIGKLIKQ